MKKSIGQRLKEKWHAYLKRLADSNRELFGDQRPDCCRMSDTRMNGRGAGSGNKPVPR